MTSLHPIPLITLSFTPQLGERACTYLSVPSQSCMCSGQVWRTSFAQQDCSHPSIFLIVKPISSSPGASRVLASREHSFSFQPAAPKHSLSINSLFIATSSSFQVKSAAPPGYGRVEKAMHRSARDEGDGGGCRPLPISAVWLVAPGPCYML